MQPFNIILRRQPGQVVMVAGQVILEPSCMRSGEQFLDKLLSSG